MLCGSVLSKWKLKVQSYPSVPGAQLAMCAADTIHVLGPIFYLSSFIYLGIDQVSSFREAQHYTINILPKSNRRMRSLFPSERKDT